MTQDRKIRNEVAELERKLKKLRGDTLSSCNMYDSELSEGEPVKKEKELEEKIRQLKKTWNKEKYLHATHTVHIKFYCPNLDKELSYNTTKKELDIDVVWFENHREIVHKNVPYGTPRIYYHCKCGENHEILLDDWKFTGLKEALSMLPEEWEKKYE